MLIIKGVLFASLLLFAAVWDMQKREIPNLSPVFLLGCGLLGISASTLLPALLGLFVTALPYFLASVLIRREEGFAIGGGDIKLMAGCGFVLGIWGGILQNILSLIFALLSGVVLSKVKKEKFRKLRIPLAPYFCAGGILAYWAVYAA